MPRKEAIETGGKRMVKLGYKPSQLWYTAEEYDLVHAAAVLDARPMTQFAIRAAVAAAKQMLKQAEDEKKG